jgi:hypothetical protein
MPKKANQLKTIHELTPKQRKFVDVLVGNWGLMSKTQAAKEAGYNSTTKNGLSEMASKLTNVNKNVSSPLAASLETLQSNMRP